MAFFFSDSISRDTAKLTALSLVMQTAGMAFNVILSDKAGTAAVGLMSLIFTMFSIIMVLANGNIFIATGRFISEAKGVGCGNYTKIMRYSLTFSLCLSLFFAFAAILLSGLISAFFGSGQIKTAVILIAASLPFASTGSCIKGFFHGIRSVGTPMKGDVIEFAFKWSSLFAGLIIFGGTEVFYAVTALSILIGEAASFIFYLGQYLRERRSFADKPFCSVSLLTDTPSSYLKSVFPILISGYVQMMLSAANEALVPAALLEFSMSSQTALSQYGMFEAMIIPAIFFPSAVLSSMANIIIPEAAKANRITDGTERKKRLKKLTENTFSKAFSFSVFVAAVFLYCGKSIGALICPSDELVGRSIMILAPVVPFIYLEIVLEAMLKGMGRQNFSTVVSLAEYSVRIGCVIIFVRLYGFYGVLISYYASNVISDIIRLAAVCHESGTRFSPRLYLVIPAAKAVFCCEMGRLALNITHAESSGRLLPPVLFVMTAVTAYSLTKVLFSDKALKKVPCTEL